MTKLIVILVAFITVGAYYMQKDYEAAMAACQVNHSFDTCFHSLNR